MRVRGPNWKKIWKKQMDFLHHKSEQQKDLYCGRTFTDWILIIFVTLAYYCLVFGFWIGCYYLFKIIIVDPSGKFPYRKGYMYGNDKIPKDSAYKSARNLAEEVKKLIPDKKYIHSHLDFPVLTHLPRLYGDDKEDQGDYRNRKYQDQMKTYDDKLHHANDEKAHDTLVKCEADTFQTDRMKDGLKEHTCQIPDDIFQAVDLCKGKDLVNSGGNNTWGLLAPTEGEERPGGGFSVENFKPCLMLKLNQIVGFIPVAAKSSELKKRFDATVKNNGTQTYAVPDLPELQAVAETGYKLPVGCWMGIEPTSKEGKSHKHDLKWFFDPKNCGVRTDDQSGDEGDDVVTEPSESGNSTDATTTTEKPAEPPCTGFITFHPGPYIDLRQYPFMASSHHPSMPTVIRLHFNDHIKPDDVITLECRVYALNIPFKYRLEIFPGVRFGAFRSRFKYYWDKKKKKNYFTFMD